MKELIILEIGVDEFIVVAGERIETETDTHAVTFRLSSEEAARIGGQEILTVAEAAILQDCQLPKATELPAEETAIASAAEQLTLFGDTQTKQLTLF